MVAHDNLLLVTYSLACDRGVALETLHMTLHTQYTHAHTTHAHACPWHLALQRESHGARSSCAGLVSRAWWSLDSNAGCFPVRVRAKLLARSMQNT